MKCRHCGTPLSGNNVDYCPTCTVGKRRPGPARNLMLIIMTSVFDPVVLLLLVVIIALAYCSWDGTGGA